MTSPENKLETQLMEAGTKLENPPAALDELLTLLDQVEIFLTKVDQSPSEAMQSALSPSLKALVADQLFKHSDVDVKAAVASCISEITRITAPEAPYDDEQMKKVFQLIVSSFENLSDLSSRSFTKRTSILETVAKVRSCVVMLDLECDSLITEMFQHFLKSIRDDQPENVFSSMETIMTLVLEESEDISLELLSLILATVKKHDEELLPIARRLGETVLKACSAKVKPYLVEAIKSRNISLDDYNEVVASICDGAGLELNDVHPATEHVADETNPDRAPDDEAQVEIKTVPNEEVNHTEEGDRSPKSAVINGVAEIGSPMKEELCPDDSKSADAPSNAEQINTTEPKNNAEPIDKTELDNNTEPEKIADAETKVVQPTKKQGRKATFSIKVRGPSPGPKDNVEKEAKKPLDDKKESKDVPSSGQGTENEKETSDRSLLPKAGDGESSNITSLSSGSVPGKTRTKKGVHAKEKDNLNVEAAPSTEDNSTKPSEETKDSEAKPQKGSVEKGPTSTSNEDDSIKLSEETKNSEAKAQKCSVENEPTSILIEETLSDSLKKVCSAKKGVRSRKKQIFNKNVTPSAEDKSAKPSEETVKPPEETAKPSEETVKPSEETAKLSEETAKPSEETAKPSKKRTKKGSGKKAPASSSKKGKQAKKKDKLSTEEAPSTEAKPSEDDADSEEKIQKGRGKKALADIRDEKMDDASPKENGDTTDTESKPLKQLADKVDDNGEEEDKNTHSEGEHVSEKDAATDEEDKEVVSSFKTAGKSTKKETPKTNPKRKRTPVTDKASLKEYDDNLVGSKVKVWWPQDKAYYNGVIDSYDSVKKKHRVLYNDGDEEVLNLNRQKWQLITEGSGAEEQEEPAGEPQPESSSEMPLRKKMKQISGSSSKAKKVASSSKSKVTTPARKSEDDSKAEGKSKDSKAAAASKSKTEKSTPKSSKPKNGDSEKSKAGKSKEDEKTPAKSKQVAGKSKVETPKASTNAKGKATKGSVKSNAKVKEVVEASENSADSPPPVKGKSPGGSAKAKGTETKSGKKRPRSSRS